MRALVGGVQRAGAVAAAGASPWRPRGGLARRRATSRSANLLRRLPPRRARPDLAGFATRPRGEPAWHRRARRARGNARALVRLAGARDLLQRHHSAQRRPAFLGRPMPQQSTRGRGGGARDGAALLGQIRQLVLGGGLGGEAGGGGRGGSAGGGAKGDGRGGAQRGGQGGVGPNGGGGGGRGGRGAPEPGRRSRREGDWDCAECAFGPNFASRANCYKCGAARGDGGRGRSLNARQDSRRGPIGAGGNAPMLSAFAARGAAVRAGEPTFRRPGSSLAAPAAAHPERLVPRPRQAPRSDGTPATAGNAATEAQGGPGEGQRAAGEPPRARWADQTPPCDLANGDDDDSMYADDDAAWEDLEADECQDDAEADAEPEPEHLRRLWEQEGRAVRLLEQQGLPDTSPVLIAARQARDQSEDNWRKARKPQPLAVRMGWMQKKVDRAAKALERARLDYEAFEEDVAQRREQLQSRIKVAEEWFWHRDGQMEELHAEAGGLVAGGGPGGTAEHDSRRNEAEQLRSIFAKEMQAFAESLEEGTDARSKANLLLAKLETAQPAGGPEQYHIGGTQDGLQDDAEWSVYKGKAKGTRRHSKWNVDAGGRWNRAQGIKGAAVGPSAGCAAQGGEHVCGTTPAATVQPAAPKAGANANNGAKGGAERGKGGEAGTSSQSPTAVSGEVPQGEVGHATGKGRNAGSVRPRDDEGGPCPKSHRGSGGDGGEPGQVGEDDAQRAERLRQEQAIAMAAALEANAVFGDEKSRQIAGQLYAHQVDMAKRRAEKVGVPVVIGGKQLIELSPEDFGDWVRSALEPAEAGARVSQEK